MGCPLFIFSGDDLLKRGVHNLLTVIHTRFRIKRIIITPKIDKKIPTPNDM